MDGITLHIQEEGGCNIRLDITFALLMIEGKVLALPQLSNSSIDSLAYRATISTDIPSASISNAIALFSSILPCSIPSSYF